MSGTDYDLESSQSDNELLKDISITLNNLEGALSDKITKALEDMMHKDITENTDCSLLSALPLMPPLIRIFLIWNDYNKLEINALLLAPAA